MTRNKRKRHQGAAWPVCTTPAKKARGTADDMSVRSATQTFPHENPLCRTEPGSYKPGKASIRDTLLPSADDWSFRVNVISSTSNLSDDIFKKAVQGLVKICLPEGILEELGIDLLAQYMRQENAPEENITRMRSVSSSEMIICISRMLAGYLDTPEKIKSVLLSVIESSTALQTEAGTKVFRDVMSSLKSQPSTADIKSNLSRISNVLRQDNDYDKEVEEMIVDAEEPNANNVPRPPRTNRNVSVNKRVSSSWRWDFEAKNTSAEAIKDAFKRPSDLFAYHALPLAKDLLTAHATRMDVRRKVQDMLDETPDSVYRGWVDSFIRLQDGDETMLVRIPPEPEIYKRTAVTPAPVIGQGQSTNVLPSRRNRKKHAVATQLQETYVLDDENVKREGHATTLNRPAIDRQVTEQQALGSTLIAASPSALAVQRTIYDILSSTPVVDLLWGRSSFIRVARADIVLKIEEQLQHRISAHSIKTSTHDGKVKIVYQEMLRARLLGKCGLIVGKTEKRIRLRMEHDLQPWVVAHPAGFPELLAEPFLFTSMLPLLTPVLDILCATSTSMTTANIPHVEEGILAALSSRGVDKYSIYGNSSKPLAGQIRGILSDPKLSATGKRPCLEKLVRNIAYFHRGSFPELKTSKLVKSWKRTSGLEW
ncbi:hypothetical protein DE146DRAFT_787890 [Phaeosphaeria sp. MPI-PUGE-AT-0046c]|nr:hypothetical protein DE146DRAFT_787890 [Phaeosphaeria sp. MPI-PUGE-AT-0046c]